MTRPNTKPSPRQKRPWIAGAKNAKSPGPRDAAHPPPGARGSPQAPPAAAKLAIEPAHIRPEDAPATTVLALAPEKAPLPQRPGTLTASRLKITCVLNATELVGINAPEDKPRVTLRIRLPDRTISADIAAKSLRKAQATIRETGAANVVLLLQGHLVAGDVIAEAGLSAQLKAPKPKQNPMSNL